MVQGGIGPEPTSPGKCVLASARAPGGDNVSGPLLVIANPRSRSGRTGRSWPEIERQLRDSLGDLEVVFTERPRHATVLAREASERGVKTIVVGGGDGTISEVVSGVLSSSAPEEVSIGLLPLGSGGDLLRTVGVPGGLAAACDVITQGRVRQVDAGRVRYVDRTGQRSEGWFVNEASMGLSADVAQQVDHMPKRLGGEVAFAAGAVRSIARLRPSRVRVVADGKRVHEGETTLVAIANGRCFGGGMKIAPLAEVDDGQFDVVVGPAFPRWALVGNLLPRLYSGRHLSHPRIDCHRASRVEIEPLGDAEPAPVEADGEWLGTLPLEVTLVPGALRVWAPEGCR